MSRPGQPPLHADGRDPGAARGDRRQDAARLRLRGAAGPGAGDQRRQAGRGQRVRRAVRPRRRGHRARPVLDDLPRVHRPGRRDARGRVLRRDDGFPLLGRGPRGGVDAQHQGAALRVAVQPDRGRLPPRRDRGHRPLGAREGDLGADRRDLRAPRLRRRRAPLHAGAGARAGRPLPGGQRRGQDLRHDGVAGRVADRPDRRHHRGHQHPEPRDLQRVQRGPAGGARRRVGRSRGRGRDARRPSTAAARRSSRCSTRSTASSAPSPRAPSTPFPRSRGCSGGTPGTTSGEQRGAGRALHQRGQGGGRPRRGVRRPGLLPHVLRPGRRRPGRGRLPVGRRCSPRRKTDPHRRGE